MWVSDACLPLWVEHLFNHEAPTFHPPDLGVGLGRPVLHAQYSINKFVISHGGGLNSTGGVDAVSGTMDPPDVSSPSRTRHGDWPQRELPGCPA